MKNSRFAVAVAISLMGLVGPAHGLLPLKTEMPGNYDQRRIAHGSTATVSAAQQQALTALKSSVSDLRFNVDPILGTPSQIGSTRGFLTGPDGLGGAVSGASLAAIPNSDPHRVVKAFLNEHASLFGHDSSVLTTARVQRDYVTDHNGMKTTVWEQELNGIPVFESLLVAHVTKKGELVNISSHFLPNLAQAATPDQVSYSAGTAPISAAQAIVNAAKNINLDLSETAVAWNNPAAGAEKKQKATVSGLFGETSVQLVWLPMDAQNMRLCWRVILASRAPLNQYLTLVDSETGEILLRRSLSAHLAPASYNVYTNDSPTPFSPGWPTPQSDQPTNASRAMITVSALDTNASPQGWIPDGIATTSGNNVMAFLDRDLTGTPDVPLPSGSGTDRVFDFPLNLAQPPISYASASTVQLFYRANWYHDRLYQMGFTEAAGNFQLDNLGRGGFGNDYVMCLVQAGADVGQEDNSLFFTPPDGESGICFMFVFNGPNPSRDGSLDQEVVCHELTHGLSNRLLGGGPGISQLQTSGMGEGWSDFYALCLLSEPTDDPNGVYATGGYASYRLAGLDYTENYYFGIRRYPYTTDMSKNPLTFKDIDPVKADPHFTVPVNPLVGGTDPSEVHNQGEVWCMTLREVWANLVSKWGWEIGNQLAMQLVTDGLRLAPANATFLEARDGILQADLVDNGGENYVEIWSGFAKRGMGYSAACPSSDTTLGVVEAFDLPPDIGTPDGILEVRITPASGEVLLAGDTNSIFLRVSDALGVTNATITATLSTGESLVFQNDGIDPDQLANNSVYSAALIVPTNLGSITLTAIITAPDKEGITNSATYFIVPPPLNDAFANATKVPAAGANYLTTSKRATNESGEPAHAGVESASGSLWWNYTATANTNILVDTGGSMVRTIVAVYTNNSLVTLKPVGTATGGLTRPGAFLNFAVKAGVTYHIAVAGYDPNNLGTLNVTIKPGENPDITPPAVTILSPLNGQIVNTNRLLISGSAADPTPYASGIREVTIRVVPIPGILPISTVVLPASLTGPLNTNWSSIVGLAPGLNEVQVTATDYSGNRSAVSRIQVTLREVDPVNDFFVNSTTLTNAAGTNSVNTQNATRETGEPNHAGSLAAKSVWWTFTAPADGTLFLSTSNSTFDTVLAIYQGSRVNQLVNVASNDDAFEAAPGGFSEIVQAVKANEVYRIAVDGYDAQSGVVFLTHEFTAGTLFHVTVSSAAGGSVTPTSFDVQSNATIIVTAIADPNYQFDIWDGAAVSMNNPLTLTVTGDLNLTAHFRPIEFTDGFESGNLSQLNWTVGGNKPWFVQTNSVSSGQFAARSGGIGNSQSSSLILTAAFRSDHGSFDYRVSSEASFDKLTFYIDGILQQQWSGQAGWANYGFSVTAGTHTLEWRYTKDANNAAGLDAAFLDNLNLPLAVGLDDSSAADLELQRQNDGTYFLNLLGQTNQQYIVQTSTNLVNWENFSTNVAVNGFIRILDPASPSTNSVRFYRAVVAP